MLGLQVANWSLDLSFLILGCPGMGPVLGSEAKPIPCFCLFPSSRGHLSVLSAILANDADNVKPSSLVSPVLLLFLYYPQVQ